MSDTAEKRDPIEIQRPDENYDRFGIAIDVQDAGNPRALAREFVRVVDSAMEETKSTTATWDDPGKAHTHTYCDKCAETEIPLPKKEAWKDRPGGRHWDTGFKWAPRWGGPCDKCWKDC